MPNTFRPEAADATPEAADTTTEAARTDADHERLLMRSLAADDDRRRRDSATLREQLLPQLLLAEQVLEVARRRCDGPCGIQVDAVTEAISEAVALSRDLLADLRPPHSEDGDLEGALRELVDGFASCAGIEVRVHVDGEARTVVAEPARTIACRVVQEGLRDVRTRARARTARVVIGRGSGGLEVRVEDDDPASGGHAAGGHTATDPREGGPRHLAAAAELVALIGGSLRIGSSNQGGTKLEATLPLAAVPAMPVDPA